VGTWSTPEINQDMLVSKMVGREISRFYTTASHEPGEIVLEVKNLTKKDCYTDISFALRKGEILGIAGLMGCKREDIVKSLYGLMQPDSGTVVLNGQTIHPKNPREAMHMGIGFVTDDRKQAGILALMSVRENITVNVLKSLSKFGLLNASKEQKMLDYYTKKMNMKYSGHYQLINSLSGGNQQKFVLARALAADCKVLILLEPTRGIDVGAKAEIYALIEDLAKQGMSILMLSSEMPEIIQNCHRSLVIFQGTLTGDIPKEQFDETTIMQCATGNKTILGGGVA
ncbi:MAG: ATP-binding cassette domain-containing protein, partial [Ruthenibacterium sp.]